ncbi:MAG: hypothetical protein Tsb0014_08560 [Pleurocapsa sp.]
MGETMVTLEEKFSEIVSSCQKSHVGKKLPNALYVHTCALENLDPLLQDYEHRARDLVGNLESPTIVKFGTDRPKISYLYYPDFDRDPHPKLQKSIIVDLASQEVSQRQYQNSENPPILHRKETFVTADYPLYEEFAELTQEEVNLGLLDNSRFIGTFQEWKQLLQQQGIDFVGHHLVCHLNSGIGNNNICIERHKAALKRRELSRPVRIALDAGLLKVGTSFFDYGCGYGGDISRIGDRGHVSAGWDPYYAPHNPLQKADVVNLGYVINVIEDMAERREALLKAWELTQQVLIVSAQVLIDDRRRGLVAYGDGVITNRNTFQKYYEQEELKIYIDQVLGVDSIPVSLGIYCVFRDRELAESFRASRLYSSVSTPRIKANTVRNFEDYCELLTPLMDFYAKRGRLPIKGELSQEKAIKAEFRTYHQAFKCVLQATDEDEWDAIAEKRRQDLLIYLALAKFGGRPTTKQLAPEIKVDFKALFGSYKQACLIADLLLVNVGDLKKIAHLCKTSPIGKRVNNALVIHVSALEKLPALLRLYEGCASRNFYRLETANLIKLYYDRPKIAYLAYPNFDTVAHPILQATMEVNLHNLSVIYHDISDEPNPLILHQKDALVSPDYHLYETFSNLTKKEEKLGLFQDTTAIRRLYGWLRCLDGHQLKIEGHRLVNKGS